MNNRFGFLTIVALVASNAFSMAPEKIHEARTSVRSAIEQIKAGGKPADDMDRIYQNASAATERLNNAGIASKKLQEDLDSAYNHYTATLNRKLEQSGQDALARSKERRVQQSEQDALARIEIRKKIESMNKAIIDENVKLEAANLNPNAKLSDASIVRRNESLTNIHNQIESIALNLNPSMKQAIRQAVIELKNTIQRYEQAIINYPNTRNGRTLIGIANGQVPALLNKIQNIKASLGKLS